MYFGADDGTGIPLQGTRQVDLSLWPVPAQSHLHLRSASVLDEVRITDLSGRLIVSVPLSSNTGTIPVADLAPGTYVLLARSHQHQLYHVQFQKVD
ncbi:MAG: T9SS type A sorting domain-containing protein [Flavobacteriales bacterium]|nr:T9SS type A sorting domain-containing protein [Flavobacteriales bacterium]